MVSFVGSVLAGAAGGASVNIVIRAVDEFSKNIKKAKGETKKLGKEGAKAGKQFTLGTGLMIAGLTGVAAGIVEVSREFFRFEQAQQAFNLVIGKTADILLTDLKIASRSMVSDFQLMASANKALQLGISQSQLPALMEVARVRAKVMGLTVTQAFNDITTGIGRQSKLILDNLGIIVSLQTAYENYAEELGKTVDQLDEFEKKAALTNAVLEQTEDLQLLLAFAEETHTEKLERLSAGFDNFKVSLGAAVIGFGDFTTQLLDSQITVQEIAADKGFTKQLQNWAQEAVATGKEMSELQTAISGVQTELQNLVVGPLTGEFESNKEIFEKQKELDEAELEALRIKQNLREEGVDVELRGLQSLIPERQTQIEQFKETQNRITFIKDEIELLRAQHKVSFDNQRKEIELYIEQQKILHGIIVPKTKTEVIKAVKAMIKQWQENVIEVQNLGKELDEITKKAEIAIKILERVRIARAQAIAAVFPTTEFEEPFIRPGGGGIGNNTVIIQDSNIVGEDGADYVADKIGQTIQGITTS